MKRILWMLILAAAMIFSACDNDDRYENYPGPMQPSDLPQDTRSFVDSYYPNARITDIDYERGVYEVDIIDNGVERELYFSSDGTWLRTTTDLRLSDVPQVVLDAVQTTEYAAWQLEDADFVQTPDGEWYLLELEERTGREREIRLKITAQGEILP